VDGPELDVRPPQLGVPLDVLLGVGVLARDQPDAVREERQAAFAGDVEQAFLCQGAAEAFESFEQVTEPDVLHLDDLHRQGAALDPVVRLDGRNHPGALLQVGGHARADARPDRERHRGVDLEVLELAVDVAARDVPLGDLALDPGGAESVDPVPQLRAEQRDRPRVVGRRWSLFDRHPAPPAGAVHGAGDR
jgi:hypothetical protein